MFFTLPLGSFESNGVVLNNTFGNDSFNFDIFIFIRMLIWSLKCIVNDLKTDYDLKLKFTSTIQKIKQKITEERRMQSCIDLTASALETRR